MKLNDSHKKYLVDQIMEYYGNNEQGLITIFTLNEETFGRNFYGTTQGDNFNTRIVPGDPGVSFPNASSAIDIYMRPTANLGVGSVTIYNYTIENI